MFANNINNDSVANILINHTIKERPNNIANNLINNIVKDVANKKANI